MLIVVLLALMLLGILAASGLTRSTDSSGEREATLAHLNLAAQALEQFAAVNHRLPCPADPALDTGDEPLPVPSANCAFDRGTLPWKALSMRHDEAYDAWGRKIAYRVYTGNKGSLTQAEGVSMLECDTSDPAPGGVTSRSGSSGGLCQPNADPLQRNTRTSDFLAGKGLKLTDMDLTVHNDVAFVVISHGSTGLGGYTVSGVQLDMPGNPVEKKNAQNGDYTILAFSGSDTSASANDHFDDFLVYRTLPDLVKRAGLSARDWPEVAMSMTLNAATLGAVLGHVVTPGDLGTNSLQVGGSNGTRISGFSGSSSTNLSFEKNGPTEGIGVSGGGGGALANLLTNIGTEMIRIDFSGGNPAFSITLGHFGTYDSGGTLTKEQAQFDFFLKGSPVGSPVVKAGCNPDGNLASFSITPPGLFDSVEVRAIGATPGNALTGFVISSFHSCVPTEVPCKTEQDLVANECP